MEPTVADKLRACAKGKEAMNKIGLETTGLLHGDLSHTFNNGKSTFLYQSLCAIADAIEEEEYEMRDFLGRLERAASYGEEVILSGKVYFPSPLDANGEIVHVGDVLYSKPYRGDAPVKVEDVFFDGKTWFVRDDLGFVHSTKCYQHNRFTVEDIL